MNDDQRPAIAYVIARAITNRKSSGVYDYSLYRFTPMTGGVAATVSVFDYYRACYVTGTLRGNKLSLHDYGQGAPVTVTLKGTSFSGYDYGSGWYFSGNVNGRSITFHDSEHAQYFYLQLS